MSMILTYFIRKIVNVMTIFWANISILRKKMQKAVFRLKKHFGKKA